MELRWKKLEIAPGFFLLLALLCFFYDSSTVVVIIASALVHEAGHLAAIRSCGGKWERLSLEITGAKIRYQNSALCYRQEALVAGAGPAASLLAGLIAAWLYRYCRAECLLLAAGINMVFGTFNLLPLHILDGGRILRAACAHRCDCEVSEKATFVADLVFLGSFAVFSIYTAVSKGSLLPIAVMGFLLVLCCKSQ